MQDIRRLVLNAVLDEVAVSGVDQKKIENIIDRLEVPRAKVDLLFGGIDQLQAEALIVIYEDYVAHLWTQTRHGGTDPEARFRARAMSQLIYCLDKPGWSVILDYPSLNPDFTAMLRSEYGERLNALFELNMGRLAQTILDIQTGAAHFTEIDFDNVPRAQMLANPDLVAMTSSIAWGLLGMTIWSSGRHTPSLKTQELDEVLDKGIQNHIDTLIQQIKRGALVH